MEYYSAIERNESASHQQTHIQLECILLSERSQPRKATQCMIPVIGPSRKGKAMEMTNRWVLARGSERRVSSRGEKLLGQ